MIVTIDGRTYAIDWSNDKDKTMMVEFEMRDGQIHILSMGELIEGELA